MDEISSVLNISAKVLTAYQSKASVHAENISNVSVEGYAAKTTDKNRFSELLSQIVSGYNHEDYVMPENNSELFVSQSSRNEVRLDDEVFLLNRAKGKYVAITEMLGRKLALHEVVVGGKK